MPTNLYGPCDNLHPENSQLTPALLSRFHGAVKNGAKDVAIWGSCTPVLEVLHMDDVAYRAHTQPMLSHINVGAGVGCCIRVLAETVARVIGFDGRLTFYATKPCRTPRKLIDVSRLNASDYQARILLDDKLQNVYCWYAANHAESF